jgi:hypothetical protein
MFGISWSQLYDTTEAIEWDLLIKYTGQGWYFNENDTMLIIQRGKGFNVYVWNGEDGRKILQDIVNFPNCTQEKMPDKNPSSGGKTNDVASEIDKDSPCQ